jgi:rubredoxin
MTDRERGRQTADEKLVLTALQGLQGKLREVLNRDPRNRRYLFAYGEAGIAERLVNYAATHNVWSPRLMMIIWPEDVPRGGYVEEEAEPDDATRAEYQEQPADSWLCPACGNSPCEFLQAQQEVERLVSMMAPETTAKVKRFHMYRHLTKNLHGQLSKNQRIQLPPCCAQGLRDLYPSEDGAYTGFKSVK